MSASIGDQPRTSTQVPGRISNGSKGTKAQRKAARAASPKAPAPAASAKASAASTSIDPPAKTRKKRRSAAQIAAANARKAAPVAAKTPTAAAHAARIVGKAPPLLMDSLLRALPATGEKMTAEAFTPWVEAFIANGRVAYGITGSITISAKAA